MKGKEWPAVVRITQSVINHSKRLSLGSRAPVTVVTGLPADNTLHTILPPDTATAKTIDQIKLLGNIRIESTMKALNSMHREVAATRSRKRKEAVDRQNRKTHVKKLILTEAIFFSLHANRERLEISAGSTGEDPYKLLACNPNLYLSART